VNGRLYGAWALSDAVVVANSTPLDYLILKGAIEAYSREAHTGQSFPLIIRASRQQPYREDAACLLTCRAAAPTTREGFSGCEAFAQ